MQIIMTKARQILAIITFVLTLCISNANAQPIGILMVHYGTNNDARRTATIDHLNSLVASSFGECTVAEAYAAPSVIKSLNKRGIQKLIVQPCAKLAGLPCDARLARVIRADVQTFFTQKQHLAALFVQNCRWKFRDIRWSIQFEKLQSRINKGLLND